METDFILSSAFLYVIIDDHNDFYFIKCSQPFLYIFLDETLALEFIQCYPHTSFRTVESDQIPQFIKEMYGSGFDGAFFHSEANDELARGYLIRFTHLLPELITCPVFYDPRLTTSMLANSPDCKIPDYILEKTRFYCYAKPVGPDTPTLGYANQNGYIFAYTQKERIPAALHVKLSHDGYTLVRAKISATQNYVIDLNEKNHHIIYQAL